MNRLPALALFALCALLFPGRASAGLTWEQTSQSFQPSVADTEVVAHFKFRNTGAVPVAITAVTAACSCTQASSNQKRYAPGASGEITATFSVGDRAGKQSEEIYVQTDEGTPEKTLLKMEIDVPKLAEVQPDPVCWLPGEALQPKRVRVIAPKNVSLHLTAAKPSAPGVSAQIEAGTAPGTFEVVVTPGELRQTFLGSIRIETDFPKKHPKALLLHVQIAR